MRSAGVLLLALLFARPYWSDRSQLGREREVVLLIDRSASMAAGSAGATPFDKAKAEASQILKDLPEGANVHLAYCDAAGVAPVSPPRVESGARPGLAATDYTKALAWARDIVVGSERLNRQVFLWTDLQRSGVGKPEGPPFPVSAQVEIIDVGRSLTRNLAVEEIQCEQTDLRGGKPVSIAARVQNAGLFAAQDVRVKLSIEGLPELEQAVSVEGRSRRVVHFEVPIHDPGLYHGYVEVAAGDDLAFDDRRWLAFAARKSDRILLVDGEPGPSVFSHETYFLEMAIRLALPGGDPGAAATPYEPERVAWDGQSAPLPSLDAFKVVCLCNVADLSPAAAAALEAFVRSGGILVIFTGDQVKQGAYAALSERATLPARIEGSVADGPYRLAGWSKDHPIFARVRRPAARRFANLALPPDHPDCPRCPGPCASDSRRGLTTAGGKVTRRRQVLAVCDSGRQRLGRVGHQTPVCAASSPGHGLCDQPAA